MLDEHADTYKTISIRIVSTVNLLCTVVILSLFVNMTVGCRPVLLCVLGLLFFRKGQSFSGWTYKTTSSNCAGTEADPCGPPYWSQVHGAGACGLTSQSPINLVHAATSQNGSYPVVTALHGGCDSWVQFSNDHAYEIAVKEESHHVHCSNLFVTFNDQRFDLRQMHFHSPSEHTIGGGYFAAEAHLVHINAETNQKLVLGVLLEEASFKLMQPSNNSFLQSLWTAGGGSTLTGDIVLIHNLTSSSASNTSMLLPQFNPYDTFLPARSTQYQYNGSLTAPPCSEEVQWVVFDQPVFISQDDLSLIRRANAAHVSSKVSNTGNSNRATQPLNGRVVCRVDPALTDMYHSLATQQEQLFANYLYETLSDDSGRDTPDRSVVLSAVSLGVAIVSAMLSLTLVNVVYRKLDAVSLQKKLQLNDNVGKSAIEMKAF